MFYNLQKTRHVIFKTLFISWKSTPTHHKKIFISH